MPEHPASELAARSTTRRSPLQERVIGTLLEAAASVLAQSGTEATMADVAAAAGVARGTVYRYFPTRTALMAALRERTIGDAGDRIEAARLPEVDARAAIERGVRALVELGDAFAVVAHDTTSLESKAFEHRIVAPLRQVFERGQNSGEIRADVSAELLTDAMIGLLLGILRSSVRLGPDDLVLTATQVYFEGTRGRPRATGA